MCGHGLAKARYCQSGQRRGSFGQDDTEQAPTRWRSTDSKKEDVGVLAAQKETGERRPHGRRWGSVRRRRPMRWFRRQRSTRWFGSRKPARWFRRRRRTAGDHRWWVFIVHEMARRHERWRRTTGEDEQAPRKNLASLRCNFEQAHQGLRKFLLKHAYIGQRSLGAVFLSQPPLKMIFRGS